MKFESFSLNSSTDKMYEIMKDHFGAEDFGIVDQKSFTKAYGGTADFHSVGLTKTVVKSITKTITTTRAITVTTPTTSFF